jgi:hypothetical protein
MFYTIVTRARCTLIIYDQHIPEQFMHIWTSHHLVEEDIYSPKIFEQARDDIDRYKVEVLEESSDSWEKKGFNFYMNKKYDLAYDCYSRLGMKDVCLKIRAIQQQERAEERLHGLKLRFGIDASFYEMDDDERAESGPWQ